MPLPRKHRASLVVTVALGATACNPRAAVRTENPPGPPSAQPTPEVPTPPTNAPPMPVGNPPPPAICPPTAPSHGTPCGPAPQRCGYPACGMPEHIMATCDNGVWAVVIGTCNPPPPPPPPTPVVPIARNPPPVRR